MLNTECYGLTFLKFAFWMRLVSLILYKKPYYLSESPSSTLALEYMFVFYVSDYNRTFRTEYLSSD